MEFLRDIEHSSQWKLVKPVDKGWSKDRKFYVESEDGRRLLLRLTERQQHAVKQREFAAMQRFWQLGIRMSEPLQFGLCGGGQYVYSLLSWLDGQAADEVIPTYSTSQQYRFGVQAGRILSQIHTVPAPSGQPEWEQRMRREFQVRLDGYRSCGIKVECDQLALRYLSDNLSLLRGRPQVLQHGDYHLGNMIVGEDGCLGIIDFNRWDYGDPYEEFHKMVLFSRECSVPFAIGQLEGYFQGEVPDLFFRLLAFYTAAVALNSVVWAISFGQAEVEGMIKRVEMILRDYAGFTTHIPSWFSLSAQAPFRNARLTGGDCLDQAD